MRYLILDSLNVLYLRSYIVNPTLSTNGVPIGGIVGSFKSLQKMCRDIKPDQVVVVWDGQGGSKKRKQLNPSYKEGRKPIRLNRFEGSLSDQEEMQNKIWQQTRLIECLNCLPVTQLMFDNVEADDIVAQIAKMPSLRDAEKVIVSSDQDFVQLCNEKTILFRPIQEEVLTTKSVVEKYGIHPSNFCLARSIAGDKADNLPGVQGIAMKGIAKRFPFLAEAKEYTIDDVIAFCSEQESQIKVFQNIPNNKQLITENYQMMQLAVPNISINIKQQVEHIIENVEHEFAKSRLEQMMLQDGWAHYNFSGLFEIMNRIMDEENR